MRLITETLAADFDDEKKPDNIIPAVDIYPSALNILHAQRAGFGVNS